MPSLRLPYSPDKRYLTGIDWVINTLDSMTRKATGHGNSSQIVLELAGQPDVARLRSLLKSVFAAFPILCGHVRRDWNLCPFWTPGLAPADDALPLRVTDLPEAGFDEAFNVFKSELQKSFAAPSDHLHFTLVNYAGNRALFGMHFDHRLLDAYGAELFLELLARSEDPAGEDISSRVETTEPAHLDNWIRCFAGGRDVNRLQLRLSRGGLAALPVPDAPKPRKTHIELVTFQAEHVQRIQAAAERESGPLMILPAFLARVVRAIHKVVHGRGFSEGHYVIPVSINSRRPEEKWQKLLFNHLSFLIFQIPVDAVEKRQDLTAMIREQLYEQMKDGVPEDVSYASMLTRIAPLGLMRQFAKIPMKGRVATNYFACLKESGFTSDRFLGVEVENLIHTPHVPPRPGLGIFMNFYQDRLNLVISHLDGLLNEEEIKSLTADLKKQLRQMK